MGKQAGEELKAGEGLAGGRQQAKVKGGKC